MKKISLLLTLAILFCSSSSQGSFRQLEQDKFNSAEQEFTPLDLSRAANRGFADDVEGDGKGGWTDQGSVNDLSTFNLRGMTELAGVEFNIIDPDKNDGRSCIVLRGQNNEYFPVSAEVEVNKKAAGIYFLHAAAWISDVVGYYTYVYDDGTNATVTIEGNKDIFNWWGGGSGERSIIAWKGKNQSTNELALGLYACENPQPEKTIEKLVMHTDGDTAYMMIVAATLTNSGPYIPIPPDIGNPARTDHWFPYHHAMINDIKGTAMDMSFLLDAPAGKHGFIHAEGEKLIFDDGTPFKFWGVNLHSEMLFLSQAEAIEIADLIASQGFNMVRFHQMDIINVGQHNIFGRYPKNTRMLDEEQMDKFCFLMSELKKRGIYWFFDQTTNRRSYEDDNIFDQTKVPGGQKGPNFYDPWIIQLHKDFAEQLFTWYNPYTGMRIADDPAFLFTDIVNENCFADFANPPSEYYQKQLDRKFTEYLRGKYQTDAAIKEAWFQEDKKDIDEGEGLSSGYRYISVSASAAYSSSRREDVLEFAMRLQEDYTKDMISYLRGLGVKALITGATSWGDQETALFNMNSGTDFVDLHQYWCHPSGGWAVSAGTKFSNELKSQLADENMGIFGYFFNRGVYGKPQTISEWNDCEPNPTSSETPILMAAYGRLHDWNPIAFAYSTYAEYKELVTTPEEHRVNEVLTILGNPLKMAGLPAAAFIALSDSVSGAEKGYYTLHRNEETYKIKKQRFPHDPAIGLIGKSGVVFEKQYDESYNSNEVLRLAEQGKRSGIYTSVTGELTTDTNKDLFVLNSGKAQAAVGYLQNEEIETDDVIFRIDTEFSTNSLCAIDNKPIESSKRLLLTTLARQRNTGLKMERDNSKVLDGGTAPVLMEPVEGEIILKNRNDYEIWILNSAGQRTMRARTKKTDEGYTAIILTADNRALNYEIIQTRQAENKITSKTATYTLKTAPKLFNDIKDEQTREAAERLTLLGVARGTGESSFSPEQIITKGEYILWLMQGLKPDTSLEEVFADVPDGSPDPDKKLTADEMYAYTERALKAVGRENYMVQKEYADGFVTRGQAAKLLCDIL